MRSDWLLLLWALAVAAKETPFLIPQNSEVPGRSPVKTCDNAVKHLVKWTKIDIKPNPPRPGEPLQIRAVASLNKTVDQGAYVSVVVKYGFIGLIDQTLDLCDLLTQVNRTCPLEPGTVSIEKTVDLPKVIPAGLYHAEARAFTHDEQLLTCIFADIRFP